MRLTLQTDYALRMLIYLALHPERAVTVADVANSFHLSRNHLLKVALKLGRLGHVKTLRGRSGGIALARLPEQLNVGEVIRQMEEDLALVECLRPDGGRCVISPACRLKGILSDAGNAFLDICDNYTLGDLVAQPEHLVELLDSDRNPAEAVPTQ